MQTGIPLDPSLQALLSPPRRSALMDPYATGRDLNPDRIVPSHDGSNSSLLMSSLRYESASSPTDGPYMNRQYFAADAQLNMPLEFLRTPTGSSIGDPNSILMDSGRFYHGYKAGKYLVPNDGVRLRRVQCWGLLAG